MNNDQNITHSARRACGMSQRLFADLVGVTQQQISKWEKGIQPNTTTALLFAIMERHPDRLMEFIREVYDAPVDAPELPENDEPVGPDSFGGEDYPSSDPVPTLIIPARPKRPMIRQALGSWDLSEDDAAPALPEPTAFTGDGPPPHGVHQARGDYDPDMGYMGGQEE